MKILVAISSDTDSPAEHKKQLLYVFRESCKDLRAARSPQNRRKLSPAAVKDIEKRIRAEAKKLVAAGIKIPKNYATEHLSLY